MAIADARLCPFRARRKPLGGRRYVVTRALALCGTIGWRSLCVIAGAGNKIDSTALDCSPYPGAGLKMAAGIRVSLRDRRTLSTQAYLR